jgi:predicted dehydrogenase
VNTVGIPKEEKHGSVPKVLVRGSGSMGSRYLRLLRNELRVPVIVYPKTAGRASELVSQGWRVIRSLEELEGEEPTHSIIATNTGQHVEDLRSLSEYGKILVEKPLATSLDDLKNFDKNLDFRMESISVAFCLRFSLAAEFFRERIATLGQIQQVRIECSSFLPTWRPGTAFRESYSAKEKEGGVLRDLAHEIDYAIWLFGYPKEVFGTLSNSGYLGIESEEAADLLWVTPGGTTVSLRLDYLGKHPVRFLKASGERGDMIWDLIESTVVVNLEGSRSEKHQFQDERNSILLRQMKTFLGSDDEVGSLASFQDGVKAVALSDAARRSSSSKTLEQIFYTE